MRCLVTGATGFVGTALCQHLQSAGIWVRSAVRQAGSYPAADETVVVGEISGTTNWSQALDGIDVVFHLAALAHVRKYRPDAATYRAVNADGTAALARAARGAARLIFLSTIKVLGEETGAAGLTESDPRSPADAYADSKAAAEVAVERELPTSHTIVRPPLVYGPGVRANFRSLLRAVDRHVPLPFGRVRNRRSLIYVRNLADAMLTLAGNPAAAGKTFHVTDGEALSTADLIRRIGTALGRTPILVPVPEAAMRTAAKLAGPTSAIAKTISNLNVDDSLIRHLIGWTPPHSLDEGLLQTALWYRTAVAARRKP